MDQTLTVTLGLMKSMNVTCQKMNPNLNIAFQKSDTINVKDSKIVITGHIPMHKMTFVMI